MPAGEKSGSELWRVIDARSGAPTGAVIRAGAGGHNTMVSSDGRCIYRGGVGYPYLDVASTRTKRVIKQIGPVHGPGIRPFTTNGSETLAFTTARTFFGFQVSSVPTDKLLYTVGARGFSFNRH
jgi:hypothetical protein